ncbi:MAG TPA: hypothetical protein VIT67_14960 [Povalibacter sp.]
MNTLSRLAAFAVCGIAAVTSATAQTILYPTTTINTAAVCTFTRIVALDGDTVVTNRDYNRIVVHTRATPVWAVQQAIGNPDYLHPRRPCERPRDGFGGGALSGDSLLVGGAGPVFGYDKHTVYVFARRGGRWNHVQRLALNPPPGYERVRLEQIANGGQWAAVAGTRVNETTNIEPFSQIDLYRLNANGTYSRRATLRNPSQAFWDYQLALSGNTLVVGDPWANRAYVYEFDSVRGWRFRATLRASDPPPEDSRFGAHVAVDGDRIVVSARVTYPERPGVDGAVYVFQRSSGRWTQRQKIEAPDDPTGGVYSFGYGVGISGDVIVAGTISASRFALVYEERDSSWVPTYELRFRAPPERYEEYLESWHLSGRTVVVHSTSMTWDPMGHVFELP